MASLEELHTQIYELLRNHKDVLYIEVGQFSLPEVVFGPMITDENE